MSSKLDAFGSIKVTDIEDVPGFKVPPAGAYEGVETSCEIKEINARPNLIINFTLGEDGDGFLKGDMFGVAYNEDGMKYNKSVVAQIYDSFGASNPLECVDAGTILTNITIAHRADKNDPEKVYCNLKKISAQ